MERALGGQRIAPYCLFWPGVVSCCPTFFPVLGPCFLARLVCAFLAFVGAAVLVSRAFGAFADFARANAGAHNAHPRATVDNRVRTFFISIISLLLASLSASDSARLAPNSLRKVTVALSWLSPTS